MFYSKLTFLSSNKCDVSERAFASFLYKNYDKEKHTWVVVFVLSYVEIWSTVLWIPLLAFSKLLASQPKLVRTNKGDFQSIAECEPRMHVI